MAPPGPASRDIQGRVDGWPAAASSGRRTRGLTRAERLLQQGESWGATLVRCWRDAIDRYSERVDAPSVQVGEE